MGAILYYLPGRNGLSKEAYSSVGLPWLIGTSPVTRRIMDGPDNQGGIIIWPRVLKETRKGAPVIEPLQPKLEESLLKFYPTGHPEHGQTWQKCDGGKFWIGWFTADPPGPADLARLRTYSGTEVELSDGNVWLLPEIAALPSTYALDAEGELTRSPHPAHRAQYDAAERLFAHIFSDDPSPVPELLELIATCMSVNYRVSYWEVAALRLFDGETYSLALSAILNLSAVVEAVNDASESVKKNGLAETRESSDSAPGEIDNSQPDIVPTGATST